MPNTKRGPIATTTDPNTDPNFGPEMTRYRALDLAIRNGEGTADATVKRAAKYAEFINPLI